jgi:hypothetical protein
MSEIEQALICTNNLIDVSKYNKLKFTLTGGKPTLGSYAMDASGDIRLGLFPTQFSNVGIVASTALLTNGGTSSTTFFNGTYEVDISTITGSYYVQFWAHSEANRCLSVDVTKIWLEV